MVDDDPFLDVLGKINFCISQQLRPYAQAEPTPDRVRQFFITLLYECWRNFHDSGAHQRSVTDPLYLSFLFLFRPE